MFKILSVAFASALAVSSASAATYTIDFDDFARGDVITSLNIGGVETTVTTTGGGSGNSGDVVVFDTTQPGTSADGDPDLGAPFTSADGDILAPGNVLIIGEAPSADSGPDTNPDDNGRGGQIVFDFLIPVTFTAFDVFDDVTNFSVFSDLGTIVSSVSLDENNEFASFTDLNAVGISSLTFDFGNASGAIDNLSFAVAAVPLPASLPLLLAGLGGLGVAARRRKIQAA